MAHNFTYIFGNISLISRLGEETYCRQFIEPSLEEFISRRLEDIACQYFSRQVKNGKLQDVYDIGSYWYADPARKKNGEFDCVLKRDQGYDFYECKFYKDPMTLGECRKEEEQVRAIQGLDCREVGFVCTAGFDFTGSEYQLISGEELYVLDQ